MFPCHDYRGRTKVVLGEQRSGPGTRRQRDHHYIVETLLLDARPRHAELHARHFLTH
jgi:hypothetical protein